MAHSNGPQVTSVASPIGIGTWFAPISTGWTGKVTPLLITMLWRVFQLTSVTRVFSVVRIGPIGLTPFD